MKQRPDSVEGWIAGKTQSGWCFAWRIRGEQHVDPLENGSDAPTTICTLRERCVVGRSRTCFALRQKLKKGCPQFGTVCVVFTLQRPRHLKRHHSLLSIEQANEVISQVDFFN